MVISPLRSLIVLSPLRSLRNEVDLHVVPLSCEDVVHCTKGGIWLTSNVGSNGFVQQVLMTCVVTGLEVFFYNCVLTPVIMVPNILRIHSMLQK